MNNNINNENDISFKNNVTILKTEVYETPSNTYVPNDSHTFIVSTDRLNNWSNYGRTWKEIEKKTLITTQNIYKEWIREFCPPHDYKKCGITFGVNGTTNTITNRELLIGENTVSVINASKNYIMDSIFGKYGYGLEELKKLLTDSYKRANLKTTFPNQTLETVLKRIEIDMILEEEVNAWQKLIENDILLPINDITRKSSEALEKLEDMVKKLIINRENLYSRYIIEENNPSEFKENIRILITNTLTDYIIYLNLSNYIDSINKEKALDNMKTFFNKLYKTIDAQAVFVNEQGRLNENLAEN